MITLSKSGNSVTFTFENNGHYLMNGTIDVPVNGLILVTDESEMATFKKLDGDPFISCLYSDLGMTKAELISWYEANMVGSTGISEEEVEAMISADTVNYFDGAEYDSENKVINFLHGDTVKAYIDASDFVVDGMIDDVSIETISGETYLVIDFNTASGKEDILIPLSDIFDADNYYTKDEVDAVISAATSDMATQTWVGQQGYITGVDLSDYATQEYVSGAVSGKADTSAMTAAISAATTDMATMTWVGQQGYITGVDLSDYATQEYVAGAVSGKADSSRVDTIEEVTARALVDLDEKKADVSAVTESLSGKQDTLVAGSGITISGNVISSEGGGATYTAGRGIAIDSGNTISFDLPISAGTDEIKLIIGSGNTEGWSKLNTIIGDNNNTFGQNSSRIFSGATIIGYNNSVGVIGVQNDNNSWSTAIGRRNKIEGGNTYIIGIDNNFNDADSYTHKKNHSYVIGRGNISNLNADGENIYVFGAYDKVTKSEEFALGKYNNSVSDGTTSGNTFFSIGNGTANNARHNALEIKQNGDIYCNNGTADIKLQDYLQIKVMAISQADYDALVQGGTVDANTLYVINNVV